MTHHPRSTQTRTPPISAPYNFVPLSENVLTPSWGEKVSHDHPFEDGVSGAIEYTLTADSPLLVAAEQAETNDKYFFQLKDGKDGYAIHGATIKGMLRSVLEIATFSRLSRLDDTRYSLRDLTPQAKGHYRDRMTGEAEDQDFRGESKSGWLTFSEGDWWLNPCPHSRVEHDDLAAFSGDDWWTHVPRVSAREKYQKWGDTSLDIDFDPGPDNRAENLSSGKTIGTLVFTGQPASRPSPPRPGEEDTRSGKKHMEFIFHSPGGTKIRIRDQVMRDFIEIHKPRRDFNYPGDEWDFWKSENRIPVFYLLNTQGEVNALGLALMFKLPYKKTIRDATPASHRNEEIPDFASLLFGHTNDKHPDKSLKSRIWCETAVIDPTTARLADTIRTALSSPKPSYYPNYVRQAENKDGNRNVPYQTLMDDKAQIRGWKRYPARHSLSKAIAGTDDMTQTLHPLEAGARFKGRIVFHNLRPAELGALIWALTWGGRHDLKHSLGTGKSLGLGQVNIVLDQLHIVPNAPKATPDKRETYQQSFIDYMGKKVPKWERTPQMRALCGMANPAKAREFQGELKHMTLSTKPPINEFQAAKKADRALAEYPGMTWSAPTTPAVVGDNDNPVVWAAVRLQYNKGSGQLSAIGPDGMRGLANQSESKPLVDSLPDQDRKMLNKNRLVASIQVEYISGKNWRITQINRSN